MRREQLKEKVANRMTSLQLWTVLILISSIATVGWTEDRGLRISRPVCAGLSGLALGIGLGIGIGALIWNKSWYRNNNGVNGGIWLGKRRRRRRDLEEDGSSILLDLLEEADSKYYD